MARSTAASPRASRRPCTRRRSTTTTATWSPPRWPTTWSRRRPTCRPMSPAGPRAGRPTGSASRASAGRASGQRGRTARGPAERPDPGQQPARRRGMIPAKFDYVRPGSVDEAVRALAGGGDDAKVIAGGQSLLPLLRLRLAYPELLVDRRSEERRVG